MTWSKSLLQKTRVLIVLVVVFNSVGNVLLAKGMRQMGEMQDWSFPTLGIYFVRTFTSVWVWLGMGALMLFFVSWLVVLSWADYSYVLPAAAAGYALVPVLGHFLLGEAVTLLHWVGVAFICMGVAIVGRTPPSTTVRD
jgi:drug/metabolite transporter (DMT)-like permease